MVKKLSIIIPVLNEAKNLPLLLQDIAICRSEVSFEIECLVVDGGSRDHSRKICRDFGVPVFDSACGRGQQLAQGARHSTGDVLLFLHADSRISPTHCIVTCEVMNNGVIAGGFHLRFDDHHPILRLAERFNQWRFAMTRVFYGDHGIFMTRGIYESTGGMPEIPIFEDVAISKQLRLMGRTALFYPPLTTSARRFRRNGIIRTFIKMAFMHVMYKFGISPILIGEWYARQSNAETSVDLETGSGARTSR